MTPDRTILVVGTWDTKDDELAHIAQVIRAQGGGVVTMDVSVLGDPSQPADISKHAVAEAGGASISPAVAGGDENGAMRIMARGAAASPPAPMPRAGCRASSSSAAPWGPISPSTSAPPCPWVCRNTSSPPSPSRP